MIVTYSMHSMQGSNHAFHAGADPRGVIEAIVTPKSYESNFFHEDFVQFGNQHSRYEAI